MIKTDCVMVIKSVEFKSNNILGKIIKDFANFANLFRIEYPRSLDPFHIISNYIK